MSAVIDARRLAALTEIEHDRFVAAHAESGALFASGREVLLGGVPMSWMSKWPGGYPVYVAEARGAHFRCVDGHDYVDLCLGDTGAMCGHAPAASVRAIQEQVAKGSTMMLPTADAELVARILGERFGLPIWQFTLTATDANRHVIRYARHLTGRPKILVHNYCYHGTVDETFAVIDADGSTVVRRGSIGAPVPVSVTTVAVEINDLAATERALRTGEIAAVLIEPALTNIGIVLPEDDYHRELRRLCDETGTLLVIDETHTLSAGPGGMTRELGLHPDFVVVGKSIGGGLPAAAFGMTAEIATRIIGSVELEDIDVGGVGGTLAGNALSLAAMRATLEEVLTDRAFVGMIERAIEWTRGVQDVIDETGLPWQVTRLGARAEYSFRAVAPGNGAEAAAADDFALAQYLHLHALNRGVLMTPFHNMALMSPATTTADVDRHTRVFREAALALLG